MARMQLAAVYLHVHAYTSMPTCKVVRMQVAVRMHLYTCTYTHAGGAYASRCARACAQPRVRPATTGAPSSSIGVAPSSRALAAPPAAMANYDRGASEQCCG